MKRKTERQPRPWCGWRVGDPSPRGGTEQRLETRNPKLETRNPKLETRNSKLETRNSKLSHATILEQVCPSMEQGMEPDTERLKIEVIINASSGPGHDAEVQQHLARAFKAAGVEPQISLARSGAEVIKLAQRAVRSDAETIVAAGGDGTVSSVAARVVESGKALGVLPFGTMNHFAKDLHIPLDLEGAVETIIARHEARVDVGEVNATASSTIPVWVFIRELFTNAKSSNDSVGESGPHTFGRRWRYCAVIRFWIFGWALTGKSCAVARHLFLSATTNTKWKGSPSAAAPVSTRVSSAYT